MAARASRPAQRRARRCTWRPTPRSLPGTWLVVPEVPHVAGPGAPSLAVALDYARFHGLRSAASSTT